MRIFGLGIPELIIIVVVILVIFGPGLFKKLGRRLKDTANGAKKGLEAGAKENGKDIDLDNVSKDDVVEKVTEFQDKVDERLSKAEKEAAEKEAAAASDKQA